MRNCNIASVKAGSSGAVMWSPETTTVRAPGQVVLLLTVGLLTRLSLHGRQDRVGLRTGRDRLMLSIQSVAR